MTCRTAYALATEDGTNYLKDGLAAGASRNCRWILPLLPRWEERAGERRAVNSARNPLSPTLSPSDEAMEKPAAGCAPTNNLGMHGLAAFSHRGRFVVPRDIGPPRFRRIRRADGLRTADGRHPAGADRLPEPGGSKVGQASRLPG